MITQSINKRKSTRVYKNKKINIETVHKIEKYISVNENLLGPLGNKIELFLIDANFLKTQKILSYGIIKNASHYIIGKCKEDKNAYLDFGFVVEKLVLYLTELGLGTCWLGGTFKREKLEKKINLNKEFVIPAIISVGNLTEKISIKDKVIKFFAKSNKRKEFKRMFFSEKFGNSIEDSIDKKIKKVLEMVRIAPSSLNSQPWRIVVKNGLFHFYIKSNSKQLVMNKIDIGIAMAHFQLTLNELGITGIWFVEYPIEKISDKNIKYMSTFKI